MARKTDVIENVSNKSDGEDADPEHLRIPGSTLPQSDKNVQFMKVDTAVSLTNAHADNAENLCPFVSPATKTAGRLRIL